ncbi:MAG: sigma-54-dependent transcriptional regulator [Pirellula sp.]|nr:sigma-54 dependent transcriptional regulator [Planctomycetota bacterium]
MAKLLVIDDEANILFTIEQTLASENLHVLTANSGREGIQRFQQEQPDAVLVDVRLPDMTGLEVFKQLHQIDAKIPVIIMTAYSRTDNAIEAMRSGAFEYLLKPVDLGRLRSLVEQAIEVSAMNHKLVRLDTGQSETDEELGADYIVGNSEVMQTLYKSIGRVAPQDVTVLLQGETGTGKELVARAIHQYSSRSSKPFLAVNCAAISESLLESELFGHERGAFTGADQRRIGKFEQVSGGTIFLDEIGDMSLSTQAKSLRLLQQQQFERLGGNTTIQTDVRIIAATNKDLKSMVERDEFRQDLYYRLSGFTIVLPPLRERLDDVPAIANHFLKSISQKFARPALRWTDEALHAMKSYSWPGNVRELANAVQYAAVNTIGDAIYPSSLPAECLTDYRIENERDFHEVQAYVQRLLDIGESDIYRKVIQKTESILIDAALKHTSGNQQAAAERLGISRMTLRKKEREIEPDSEL